jgi:hypothetical protein
MTTVTRLGQSNNGNVGIANHLNFENAPPCRKYVKCTIDIYKKSEHLSRLPSRALSSKSRDVQNEDSTVGKQVDDGATFALSFLLRTHF